MARCAQVGKLKKEISHKEKAFHSKEEVRLMNAYVSQAELHKEI